MTGKNNAGLNIPFLLIVPTYIYITDGYRWTYLIDTVNLYTPKFSENVLCQPLNPSNTVC